MIMPCPCAATHRTTYDQKQDRGSYLRADEHVANHEGPASRRLGPQVREEAQVRSLGQADQVWKTS